MAFDEGWGGGGGGLAEKAVVTIMVRQAAVEIAHSVQSFEAIGHFSG